MAKRLTYNEATALWYARHPDLIPLRGSWQAITCSTCGYLDETMEPAWWACPQCLKLVQQPGHLRPVVSISCAEVDDAVIEDYFDRSEWPPSATPTSNPTEPQAPVPEPVTAPAAQPAPPSQPLGITCRVVTTKRK